MSDDQASGRQGRGGDPPAILSRKELRKARHRRPHRGWLISIIGLAVVVIAAAVVLLVNRSKPSDTAAKLPTTTSTTAKASVSASTAPVATCPLTGTPAPGGAVPARPALGVKVGNYTGDRPSAGLNQADVVFEEPVEGSITRLVAVYQCQAPALVGDLRSAREPDVDILSQLSHPLFAHAGGIDPIVSMLQAAPLTDENVLSNAQSVIIRQPGRVAPYAFFLNTSSVWALQPQDTTPPAAIFQYSAAPPAGSISGSGASVHIPFSSTSDVTWTWSPTTNTYLRSYSGQPDTLLDGSQTATTNIVAMTVQTQTGPWVENEEGGHEVEVQATGSGPVVVLRNGTAITGTWNRASATQPATLTASNGTPITLAPGNTWEELVPAGISVTTTASPVTTATTSPATTTAPPSKATAPAKKK